MPDTIQTLYDTGTDHSILSKMDGAVYSLLGDCVLQGIGDEFTVTRTQQNTVIKFLAGSQCFIGGGFLSLKSDQVINLSSSIDTIYLCATINSAASNGSTGYISQRTANDMMSENLNKTSGGERDLLLYIITMSGTGDNRQIQNIEDKRSIRGGVNSIAGTGYIYCTQEQWEDDSFVKPVNTVYYIVEDEV